MSDVCKNRLETIGNNVERLRKQNNISQERFAMMTGINQPQLSRIEKGQVNVTVETLERIAKGLNCDMSALIN